MQTLVLLDEKVILPVALVAVTEKVSLFPTSKVILLLLTVILPFNAKTQNGKLININNIKHLSAEDIRIAFNHEDIKYILEKCVDAHVYNIDHHHRGTRIGRLVVPC